MAEILLIAVINKSIEIAGNVLFQEGTRLYWLKEDIDWLHREMRHIRSYVDDAKAKEVGGDSRVKNLLKDIQQLAGDVEDLLDEFLPKIQQSNNFICCLKTVSFADEFAMEIEKIKRRVADIDRVRTTYNITDTSNNNDDCIPLDRRRLFLHADETEVIGLDDDFNTLQAKLLDHDLPYGVVSIVGMPGLGKTTLAKKLYRHVRHQFESSGLVYVSQQPRAGEILRDIAKQVGLTEEERKENLEGNLRLLLKTKRYPGSAFSTPLIQLSTPELVPEVESGRWSAHGWRLAVWKLERSIGHCCAAVCWSTSIVAVLRLPAGQRQSPEVGTPIFHVLL